MTFMTSLEWTAAATALLGLWLMSFGRYRTGWAYLAFLLSSACWMGFALGSQLWGLATMHAAFFVISAVGLARHALLLLAPTPRRKVRN